MPTQIDDSEAVETRVSPAPLMELESTMCGLGSGKRWDGLCEVVSAQHPDLARKLHAFWSDEHQEWVELFVILDRAGLILEQDPEPVLKELPRLTARGFRVPKLPTEETYVRAVVQRRVDRLAEDGALREQYAALLLDLWDVARPEWYGHGRATAEAMTREVQARLEGGETVASVLPPKHLALNDAFRPLLEGQPVVVTPLGLGGSGKYILQVEGGPVYVGFGPAGDRAERHRLRREEATATFKVLSDPTRLGILEMLLSVPSSVSDLARTFDVSQPTVSAHVKVLRDAGLLNSTRKGAHTLYRVKHEALRGAIERATRPLLDY